MAEMHIIEVLAGYRPDGQPVIERLEAYDTKTVDQYRLINSAAFAPGLAKDDLVVLEGDKGAYTVIEHSGNLSMRVLSKVEGSDWQEPIKAALEKIGASIDRETPRMMIASIHVSVGFKLIEQALEKLTTTGGDIIWQYGNVYNPETGEPLNWWQDVQNET